MSRSPLVLVVDDDRLCRETTARQLRGAGYEVEAEGSPLAALARLDARPWDVVVSDLRMPSMTGVELMRQAKAKQPGIDFILITAYGSVESAVTAMQEGAADYLTKPFPFAELDLRLRRLCASRASRRELRRLRGLLDESAPHGMVGRCEAMRAVYERIELFAGHDAPVLVTGETGTGKELVARAIHDQGGRRAGPFVAVACGAVPPELAESTFLGHEKGAFTGAIRRRSGCFEQAHHGTLLLDDIDDLRPDIQVKLLRVLQEGTTRRVGGEREVRVDVRVVATTKVDLSEEVQERRFRDDLYYRIRGLEIELPPLRTRGEDILLLADHFLRSLSKAAGRPKPDLTEAAVTALRRSGWPGNVRELRRAMESAFILSRGEAIRPEHLPAPPGGRGGAPALYTLNLSPDERLDLTEALRRFEGDLLSWAMEEAGGRQTRAADLLGIPRTTLQSKLGRDEPEG